MKYNKRPYAHLYKTNRTEYNRLAAQEFREKNPNYYTKDNRGVIDEWRKLDKNIFDELPNDVILVDGFPTYYVRANGEVWRDTRGVPSAVKHGKERVIRLTPTFNSHNGYWIIQPYKDKKKLAIHLHRFILTAFKGKANFPKAEVHHIDADTSNNAIDNLMWVTRQENVDFVDFSKRKVNKKTLADGRKVSESRWSSYHHQIIGLYNGGFAPRHIANKLDIPRSSIYGLMRKLKQNGEI